jgi:hypothetical protein
MLIAIAVSRGRNRFRKHFVEKRTADTGSIGSIWRMTFTATDR